MGEPAHVNLPELCVTPDPVADGARRAADAILELVDSGARVRVAITGGSAAASVPAMVERLRARNFDFGALALTWIDERCVPLASPDSNRGALQRGASRFEPALGVELPLYLDDERPEQAVHRVERELLASFDGALDVVLLGLGEDGHIASIFPGRPELPGLVAHVAESPKPPPDRITLTRALLATAQCTVLVAAGEGKRAALEGLARGSRALPATGLPGLVICTDLELGGRA